MILSRDELLKKIGIQPESFDPPGPDEVLPEKTREHGRALIRKLLRHELDAAGEKVVRRMIARSRAWKQVWGEVIDEEAELAKRLEEEAKLSKEDLGDTGKTINEQKHLLQMKTEKDKPKRVFGPWMGWVAVAAAASILIAVIVHFANGPDPIDAGEVLVAQVDLQYNPTRSGDPPEKVSQNAEGTYEIKKSDYYLVIRSPRKGFATVAIISPVETKVYPRRGQDGIQIHTSEPVDFGPLTKPSMQSVVLVIVTASPASKILRHALSSLEDSEDPMKHIKIALWSAGHKWAAINHVSVAK